MTRFLIKDSNSGIRCWRMLVSSITCVGVFFILAAFPALATDPPLPCGSYCDESCCPDFVACEQVSQNHNYSTVTVGETRIGLSSIASGPCIDPYGHDCDLIGVSMIRRQEGTLSVSKSGHDDELYC